MVRRYLLSLLLFAGMLPAWGAEPVTLHADTVLNKSIVSRLVYAPATTAPGTPPVDLEMKPIDARTLSGDVWVGFNLDRRNGKGRYYFVQIENPRIEHTEVWLRIDGQWQARSLEGPAFGIGTHVSNLPRVLAVVPNTDSIVAVRVRMSDGMRFSPALRVIDDRGLDRASFMGLFVAGAGFGILVLLIGFNALIARFTRDRRYWLLVGLPAQHPGRFWSMTRVMARSCSGTTCPHWTSA